MQQAAAAAAVVARPARRRCTGEEVVGGRRPGLVRLGFARRRWSRLRLSPARAHLAVDRSREAGEEAAAVVEEEGEAAVRLFVGLPSDVVTADGRAVNRGKAVSAGLRR